MSFEGSEKKVEVVLRPGSPSLRDKGDSFWESIVQQCNATILSSISNQKVTAYLLSESSLFVWDDRFLMITCGQTTLINSVFEFLKEFDKELVDSLIFQRKNEYYSHMQETDFMEDVSRLRNVLPGKAYRFGQLDGHHTFLFHLDKEYDPKTEDKTFELLMYHIRGQAALTFRSGKQQKEAIRELIQTNELLPGFKIDDFVFNPYGYSLNAIKDDYYATIHVTPEEGSSYVSFETNYDVSESLVLDQVVNIFNPSCFDLISFNSSTNHQFKDNYQTVSWSKEKLSCGYQVDYKYLSETLSQAEKPVEL